MKEVDIKTEEQRKRAEAAIKELISKIQSTNDPVKIKELISQVMGLMQEFNLFEFASVVQSAIASNPAMSKFNDVLLQQRVDWLTMFKQLEEDKIKTENDIATHRQVVDESLDKFSKALDINEAMDHLNKAIDAGTKCEAAYASKHQQLEVEKSLIGKERDIEIAMKKVKFLEPKKENDYKARINEVNDKQKSNQEAMKELQKDISRSKDAKKKLESGVSLTDVQSEFKNKAAVSDVKKDKLKAQIENIMGPAINHIPTSSQSQVPQGQNINPLKAKHSPSPGNHVNSLQNSNSSSNNPSSVASGANTNPLKKYGQNQGNGGRSL